jgi:hypothetical protein
MNYYLDEDNIREDLVLDAFERLLQIMEEQREEWGEVDFPDACSDACSEFDLTEDEEQELKNKYDDMCNRL